MPSATLVLSLRFVTGLMLIIGGDTRYPHGYGWATLRFVEFIIIQRLKRVTTHVSINLRIQYIKQFEYLDIA